MTDERVKIRPEVRDLWAQRLVDESYTQLREALTAGWKIENDGKGHSAQACCLGVLTGVAIEQGVEGVRWSPNKEGDVEVLKQDPDTDAPYWEEFLDGDLPEQVERWAFGRGFHSNPILREDGTNAIKLNDDLGLSFEEIAALVRDLPVLEEGQ